MDIYTLYIQIKSSTCGDHYGNKQTMHIYIYLRLRDKVHSDRHSYTQKQSFKIFIMV